MSSDLLRRAAAKLREHANRAPEGPWVSLDGGDRLVALRENREDWPAGFRYLVDEPIPDSSIAEYFALMQPSVALALADLIDEGLDYVGMREPGRYPVYVKAVAAARAVLREPEVTS